MSDGTPFIVFEYVEGQDVEHLIQARQLSLEQAVQIANNGERTGTPTPARDLPPRHQAQATYFNQ